MRKKVGLRCGGAGESEQSEDDWIGDSQCYLLQCPSREHINNNDDSLMLSSITSMMHQFYIEHRKH